MKNTYVELNFTHKSFKTGRTAIVAVHGSDSIDACAELAKEKLCNALGLEKNEIVIFDYDILGQDVHFILH